MIRSLWELARATVRYGLAKLSARKCPPHEYDERFGFCVRCGAYEGHGERAS